MACIADDGRRYATHRPSQPTPDGVVWCLRCGRVLLGVRS